MKCARDATKRCCVWRIGDVTIVASNLKSKSENSFRRHHQGVGHFVAAQKMSFLCLTTCRVECAQVMNARWSQTGWRHDARHMMNRFRFARCSASWQIRA